MKKGSLALDLSGLGGALNQGEKLQDAYEQNEGLKKRITELEEQISRIGVEGLERSIDCQFKDSEKIISVPINQITPYPGQPRKTFSLESLRILKRQISADGQEEPVKLIRVDARQEYLLWDGERRWRVALELGLPELKARVVEMPNDLHTAALKGFLTREDLNALDRAEAVIHSLCRSTNISENECAKGLRSGIKKLERRKAVGKLTAVESLTDRQKVYGSAELSDRQILCLEGVLGLGLNVSSFVAGDLSLLSLPSELKDAIRDGVSVGVANRLRRLWKNPPSVNNLSSIQKEAIEKGKSMTVAEAGRFVTALYPNNSESTASLLIRKLSDLDVDTLQRGEKEILKNQLEDMLSRLS